MAAQADEGYLPGWTLHEKRLERPYRHECGAEQKSGRESSSSRAKTALLIRPDTTSIEYAPNGYTSSP